MRKVLKRIFEFLSFFLCDFYFLNQGRFCIYSSQCIQDLDELRNFFMLEGLSSLKLSASAGSQTPHIRSQTMDGLGLKPQPHWLAYILTDLNQIFPMKSTEFKISNSVETYDEKTAKSYRNCYGVGKRIAYKLSKISDFCEFQFLG